MNQRTIKFRAWDVERSTWLNPEEFKMNGLGVVTWILNPKGLNDTVILEQFTGLLDRNGKEIYEGDIVKAEDIICEVKWVKTYWSAVWTDSRGMTGRPSLDFRNLEVVGNIYEHPHLLN